MSNQSKLSPAEERFEEIFKKILKGIRELITSSRSMSNQSKLSSADHSAISKRIDSYDISPAQKHELLKKSLTIKNLIIQENDEGGPDPLNESTRKLNKIFKQKLP